MQTPITSSEKQEVGAALTKALQAMQNHAGGSKYEACAEMFPNGKPPADQNSPTWVSCKSQFYAYAAASLIGTKAVASKGKHASFLLNSVSLNQPLSSSDKQAVGEALTKALNAMQNHAGGSKYEACADMFPNGQPPADQSNPTWIACRNQFYAFAAASLVQQPLSPRDKQAVGEALTKALKAVQGHAGGSKYEACADMFPNGQPPADPNSPTWVACKDQFYTRSSLVGTKSITAPHKLPEQGYEGKDVRHQNMKSITSDWGGEYGPTTQRPYHSDAHNSVPAVFFLAVAVVLNWH